MVWSPSSVNNFMACPRLWWLKRHGVDERPRDETALNMGTQFHASMAAYWATRALTTEEPMIGRAMERVITQEGAALEERGVLGAAWPSRHL